MGSSSLGRPLLVRRTRFNGAWAVIIGVFVTFVGASYADGLTTSATPATDAAIGTAVLAAGLGIIYVGSIIYSTVATFHEHGVRRATWRGERVVRYDELEEFGCAQLRSKGSTFITLTYRTRDESARPLVAQSQGWPKHVREIQPIIDATAELMARRLGESLQRTRQIQLRNGSIVTPGAVAYKGKSVPIARLTLRVVNGTIDFRDGEPRVFSVRAADPNMYPALRLLDMLRPGASVAA